MNKLVEMMEQERKRRNIKSYRALSNELGFSHAHIANVVNGKQIITWDFAATVADWLEIEKVFAFQMAGLL